MKQANLVIKFIRLLLLNVKWLMLGILLLNLFAFGYWRKMTERGLCDEETFWGTVIIIVLLVFFVFDRVWKKIVNKFIPDNDNNV